VKRYGKYGRKVFSSYLPLSRHLIFIIRVLSPYYFLRTSPFTGYLPLPRHFIFIITLFISIIAFWKKRKLNSEKIWKIWKKSQLNIEMIWKIWKKRRKRYEKYGRK
jgi:hypothetical protein